jgi:hypothetical protein
MLRTQAVKELESIAPCPRPGEFDVAKTGVGRKWSVYHGGLAAGRRDSDFYIHIGRLSPGYGLDDRKAWDASGDFTMTTLWPRLVSLSFEDIHALAVPIFLFLGRHDTTAPVPNPCSSGRRSSHRSRKSSNSPTPLPSRAQARRTIFPIVNSNVE